MERLGDSEIGKNADDSPGVDGFGSNDGGFISASHRRRLGRIHSFAGDSCRLALFPHASVRIAGGDAAGRTINSIACILS